MVTDDKPESDKPELRVTVFSDYICPFCYIGDARLHGLRSDYDLKVNWCFLEIHPETPEEGMPVTSLKYSKQHLEEMTGGFYAMAREEGLPLSGLEFTTNSHYALLLAEAAKQAGKKEFYSVHRRIFEAYFGEGKNIGDQDVLRKLADDCGLEQGFVDNAWDDEQFANRLERNLEVARELKVSATPTYFFTDQALTGAVTLEQLQAAAKEGLVAQSKIAQAKVAQAKVE